MLPFTPDRHRRVPLFIRSDAATKVSTPHLERSAAACLGCLARSPAARTLGSALISEPLRLIAAHILCSRVWACFCSLCCCLLVCLQMRSVTARTFALTCRSDARVPMNLSRVGFRSLHGSRCVIRARSARSASHLVRWRCRWCQTAASAESSSLETCAQHFMRVAPLPAPPPPPRPLASSATLVLAPAAAPPAPSDRLFRQLPLLPTSLPLHLFLRLHCSLPPLLPSTLPLLRLPRRAVEDSDDMKDAVDGIPPAARPGRHRSQARRGGRSTAHGRFR